MRPGTLFLVVGPSGAGKDTLIDGARRRLAGEPGFVFPRRTITRPADAGGEAHDPATPEQFAAREAAGGFFAVWSAHGLRYGLPASIPDDLAAGRNVVANVSRAVPAALAGTARISVVEVDAPPSLRAARLARRNREETSDVARRLARSGAELPEGIAVHRIVNDSTPELGIDRLVAALHAGAAAPGLVRIPIDTGDEPVCYLHRAHSGDPVPATASGGMVEVRSGGRRIRCALNVVEDPGLLAPGAVGLSAGAFARLGAAAGAPASVRPAPDPASRAALRAKIGGRALTAEDIDAVVGDMGAGRYAGREIAAFLVAAARGLDDGETVALAHSRAAHSRRLRWAAPVVADKHSLGGIPGTRVSMVVVPIAAAAGLTIPKTSSRAITSAAGTADAMEVLARVDLAPDEIRRTVEAAGGCIAWNGRISHSPVDEVMNALTRPLGIESHRLSVASILSKKAAAGATHTVIDVPVGPTAKVRSHVEAAELARLFRLVADALGLAVAVEITDGRHPVGRGVGPALEARDAMAVLRRSPDAPADLREKSLTLAARILAFDGGADGARARAVELLDGGAALAAMDRIVDAQGRNPAPPAPGPFTREISAGVSGTVAAVDCRRIAGIARRAGAPADKGAGIDLFRRAGEAVAAGEPLYRIHAERREALEAASVHAEADPGFAVAAHR